MYDALAMSFVDADMHDYYYAYACLHCTLHWKFSGVIAPCATWWYAALMRLPLKIVTKNETWMTVYTTQCTLWDFTRHTAQISDWSRLKVWWSWQGWK